MRAGEIATPRPMSQPDPHPNDPLHGVTLEAIVTAVIERLPEFRRPSKEQLGREEVED